MDQDIARKTIFMTDYRNIGYKKMLFGFKNAGVTYEWLVDQVFKGQIGKSVDVYIDNIVIKSRRATLFPQDLKEMLKTIKWVGLELTMDLVLISRK